MSAFCLWNNNAVIMLCLVVFLWFWSLVLIYFVSLMPSNTLHISKKHCTEWPGSAMKIGRERRIYLLFNTTASLNRLPMLFPFTWNFMWVLSLTYDTWMISSLVSFYLKHSFVSIMKNVMHIDHTTCIPFLWPKVSIFFPGLLSFRLQRLLYN